jgi:predicted CoA-substrate-specific enzyme activase
MWLGIDCGSVSIKGVVVDDAGDIVSSYYTKNVGLIDTVKGVLHNLVVDDLIEGVGITGSGKEFVATLIGGDVLESEVIAHYVATTRYHPDVATIFDIGGEDCKLMIVDHGNLVAFSMNRDCGGGTGAMIESIAHRMGISIEAIGVTAQRSRARISIPSKCGIFAQSAVVSKLNKGIPKEDILMGVCRGLVGNYFTMLAKGLRLRPPYVFQGATAMNSALVQCFEEEIGGEVVVPLRPDLMGAIGIALLVREDFRGVTRFKGWGSMNSDFTTQTYYGRKCTNQCEITRVLENQKYIGCVGNRCDKCVRTKQRQPDVVRVSL